MIPILILFPAFIAACALLPWHNGARPFLLPLTGAVHAAATAVLVLHPPFRALNGWLALDPLSLLILVSVSALYFPVSFYAVGYLRFRRERKNRVFVASFSSFLALLSLAVCSRHLGLMWVAIEGTTLVTAPLIYFNRSARAIEATWKYLLVGSVGIALALLGTFFVAYSSLIGGCGASLDLDTLMKNAPRFSAPVLRSGFILLLVGYGTKMGLAPMHSWKPDAYGEAPAVAGAILSGGVTSGAFLALMRAYGIVNAAGEGAFASRLLIGMGLLSIAAAAVFMANQRDFKRLLAYSSVEHMGILALGVGIGGAALYGALLHVVMNSLTKGALFLSAGNIHRAYGNKSTDSVRGALRRVPFSASLFLAGFLAITGSPPFGPFVSEFTILTAAFTRARAVAGILFLAFLLAAFIGMGITVLKVVQGTPPEGAADSPYRESALTTVPAAAFMLAVLVLGIYVPPFLRALIARAALFAGYGL